MKPHTYTPCLCEVCFGSKNAKCMYCHKPKEEHKETA